MSLTAQGGALFPVTRPILIFADEVNGQLRPIGYCLAIVKNDISINIIGRKLAPPPPDTLTVAACMLQKSVQVTVIRRARPH